MLAVITAMSPTNRPLSASRRDTSHVCVGPSNVITMSAGCVLGITELIAGLPGWKGSEIMFQPGCRLIFTGLAETTSHLEVWPAVPEALPAESVAFTFRL